jgi:alpha-galactosidase
MTFKPEDGQPSVFLLRQSPWQSILTIFNWTDKPRTRASNLKDLGLSANPLMVATWGTDSNATFVVEGGAIRIENQPPQSAMVIKLVDPAVAEFAPTVTAQVPPQSKAGGTLALSAQSDPDGASVLSYHSHCGDGTLAGGSVVAHCYTRAADFTVRPTVDEPDDVLYEQRFSIGVTVTGELKPIPLLHANRCFEEADDQK